MAIDGILNVLKPTGLTSFDVVALIRRFSKQKKVGHCGTLDPGASGVLIVCLGKATKLIDIMSLDHKKYRASIVLGITTETYDLDGRILQKSDCSQIQKEQVMSALNTYTGTYDQIPPMYSAIKQKGVPLYRLARKGIEISRTARRVTIHSMDMIDWSPPEFTIDIHCGKGTYIRSLAYDIGQSLGCGATLQKLVRLQNGIFNISDSVPIDLIEKAFVGGLWTEFVYPMDTVLLDMPATIVNDRTEALIRNGTAIELEKNSDNSKWCRTYSMDGRLLAVLKFEQQKNLWQPIKVFI